MFTFIGMNLFAIYFYYLLSSLQYVMYPLFISTVDNTLSFFIIGIGRILSIVWVILKHQLLALLNFSVICFYCYKFCSKQCFIYIANVSMYYIFFTIKVQKIFKKKKKLNIQKTKVMTSGPITSQQIDGETVDDFIFLGSKITAGGDFSHEIKRRLLLGRKVMTNLDSIVKNRHFFANTGPSSQSYAFSNGHVWMWELDRKES